MIKSEAAPCCDDCHAKELSLHQRGPRSNENHTYCHTRDEQMISGFRTFWLSRATAGASSSGCGSGDQIVPPPHLQAWYVAGGRPNSQTPTRRRRRRTRRATRRSCVRLLMWEAPTCIGRKTRECASSANITGVLVRNGYAPAARANGYDLLVPIWSIRCAAPRRYGTSSTDMRDNFRNGGMDGYCSVRRSGFGASRR